MSDEGAEISTMFLLRPQGQGYGEDLQCTVLFSLRK